MLSEYFARELELVESEDLRQCVRSYLDYNVGEWFLHDGASSSGKFHPVFAQGEGGLIRHTKAVVMFAEELLRMSNYSFMKDEYKDYVIVACILHDTRKYGHLEPDKSLYPVHGALAASDFQTWCREANYEPSEFLLNAIKSHMGQWTPDRDSRPFTNIDRCVHMADYMASRSFIDIPSITQEYNEVKEAGGDLPF